MIKSRKGILTTVVAAAALLLAACGSGESGGNDTAAPSGSASATTSAATSPAADALAPLLAPITWSEPTPLSKPIDVKGKTIWWVPIGPVPAVQTTGAAFQAAVEAAGGTVKICDGKFNPADIGQCLTSAGDQGADAVVTYYIDYEMVPNAIDALTAKGIPVLVAGAVQSKPNTDKLAFVDTSSQTVILGETVATGGIVAVGDAKPSAIAVLLLDTPNTKAASDALVAKYKELCPDCAIETVDYSSANADKLASNAAAALVKAPDANVILLPVDGMVPAVQQALKTSGREDVKIVAALGDLANIQNVKAGTQAGDAGIAVTYMGWAVASNLFQMLVGDQLSEWPRNVVRYFDSSNVGDLDLTPEGYNSGTWYGDNSYEAAYKTAWGIG